MTLEELEEIVASLREVGADLTHVEAKRAERALPRRLWETLSAFANTPGGGVIILGVDEESGFQVTSVSNPANRITHADYRRLNPGLDSAEVTRHLGVKPTRATYLLQTLRDRGVLRQAGERRWVRYTLADL